jgi:LacI family transcriptional regulator
MVPISPNTKHKILDAATEMGLRLNSNIGVIVPCSISYSEFIFHAFSAGLSSKANKYGYGIFTSIQPEEPEEKNFIPDFLKTRNVAGVIFLGEISNHIKEYIEDERIPYVFADTQGEALPFNSIKIDYKSAMRNLLSHLFSQGYTKYFLLSSMSKPFPSYVKQEFDCFNKFLSKNNLPGEILLEKEDKAGLLKKIDKEVQNAASKTVFIANSRFLTIKLLELFYAHGKNMPHDAGLVGNHLIAEYMEPKLTTQKISFYNIGETAVDMMEKIWKNKNKPIGNITIESQLIINGSTLKTA